MTYTMDYTAAVTTLNAKLKKAFNETVACGLDPTEEMLTDASKYWELAYNRTKELAEANGISFYSNESGASEWLFAVYDDGDNWPDDDELLEALEEDF